MSDDLTERSAVELAVAIRRGDTNATDVVAAHRARIDTVDRTLNAFVTVCADDAMEAAEAADAAVETDRDLGPLHGVPIALKDLGAQKAGVRHTFGSALFDDHVADRTAAIVERLEDAGAIVLGKTNTPEFGHKGTTQNEVVGATASPVDPSLNAGGSSGGSAAAVGAGMVPIATGSDAGGSLRIPAAMCGVYAIKPTFGVVPDDGRPSAFGRTIHHTTKGPITRTVQDAAAALEVMAGPHPADPHSVPVETNYTNALGEAIDDLRIGYSPDLDAFPVADAVESVVTDAVTAFEDAGATVDRVAVDHGYAMDDLVDAVVPTFTTAMADVNAVLAAENGVDLRDHPDAVSESLLEMIAAGDGVETTDIAATEIVRTTMFDAIQTLFADEDYDLLVTPTLSRADVSLHGDLEADAWEFALTWPFNWTGHPAASIPAGTTAGGAPVGLQLVGPRFDDATVLAASDAFEAERPWPQPYDVPVHAPRH